MLKLVSSTSSSVPTMFNWLIARLGVKAQGVIISSSEQSDPSDIEYSYFTGMYRYTAASERILEQTFKSPGYNCMHICYASTGDLAGYKTIDFSWSDVERVYAVNAPVEITYIRQLPQIHFAAFQRPAREASFVPG